MINERLNEVSELLKKGLNNIGIAKQLGIKESSVERYIRFLKERFPHIGNSNTSPARILLLDIETLPMEILVWGLYKQKPSYDQVIKEWCICTWSAKWLFEPDVISASITPKEALARKDTRILKPLWDLLEEADIVIGHNAAKFDLRKINARFIASNMIPPTPYRIIDTLREAQKVAAFSSHKLNEINRLLKKTEKIKTEYELWRRCSGINNTLGEQEEAIKEMLKYNENDVFILEELYVTLRPWIKSHPNIGLYVDTDETTCPNCGGSNLDWKGHYSTYVNMYNAFRCLDCGAIGRSRVVSLDKESRAHLSVSIAR